MPWWRVRDETMHWHVSKKTPKNQPTSTAGLDGSRMEREIVCEMTDAKSPRRTAVIANAIATRMSIDLAGRRSHFRDAVLYRLEKLAGIGVIVRSQDVLGRSCWAWP